MANWIALWQLSVINVTASSAAFARECNKISFIQAQAQTSCPKGLLFQQREK